MAKTIVERLVAGEVLLIRPPADRPDFGQQHVGPLYSAVLQHGLFLHSRKTPEGIVLYANGDASIRRQNRRRIYETIGRRPDLAPIALGSDHDPPEST